MFFCMRPLELCFGLSFGLSSVWQCAHPNREQPTAPLRHAFDVDLRQSGSIDCQCASGAIVRAARAINATVIDRRYRLKSKRRCRACDRVTEQAAGGQGEKPGPDDSLDDSPFYAAETFDRAYTHDRS